jgi:hypothetical protein
MTEALERIRDDFRDFSDGISRCRTPPFTAADIKDAYARLSRIKERYDHEKGKRALDALELQAFRKVFEDDRFIEGMLNGRQIAEHVTKRIGGGPVLYTPGIYPVPLSVQTSARAFFADHIYRAIDAQGHVTFFNHLDQLEEAKRRIESAITHATNKLF